MVRVNVFRNVEVPAGIEIVHVTRSERRTCAGAELLVTAAATIIFIYGKGFAVRRSQRIGNGAVNDVRAGIGHIPAGRSLAAVLAERFADLQAGRSVSNERSKLRSLAMPFLDIRNLCKRCLRVRFVCRGDVVYAFMEVRDHVIGDHIGRRNRVLRIDRGILVAMRVAVGIDVGILLRCERKSRIRVLAPNVQFLSDLIGDSDLGAALLLDLHRHGIDRRAVLAEESAEGILQRHAGDRVTAKARIPGSICNHGLSVALQQADADFPGESNRLGIGI